MTTTTLAERIVEAWEGIAEWANETRAQVAIDMTLEEAAATLWDDLPEIQRKNIRLNHTMEHQHRREFADDIRAMKDKP